MASLKAFLPFSAGHGGFKIPTYVLVLCCTTHTTKHFITKLLYPHVTRGLLKLSHPQHTSTTIASHLQRLPLILARSSSHENSEQPLLDAAAGGSYPSPSPTEVEASRPSSTRNNDAREVSPETPLTIQLLHKWATLISWQMTRLLFLPIATLVKRSVALSFLGSPPEVSSSFSALILHEVYPKGSWFGLGLFGGQVLDYSVKLIVCMGLRSVFKSVAWRLNRSHLAYNNLP